MHLRSNVRLPALLSAALIAVGLFGLPAAAQDAPPAAPPADSPAAVSPPEGAAPAEGAPDAAPGEPAEGDAADEAAAEGDDEGATTPDPTEAPAEAAMGSLTISSSPNGRVYLDGEDTGQDTPVIDLQVAPGTHTVRVVDQATGRAKEVTFHLESGAVLNLNVNLPEAGEMPAEPAASTQPADASGEAPAVAATVEETDDWTWMTVAGWASLGIGTLGLLAGAVILTTPTDPNQGPLGFGLFGAGAGLVLGGGVLLYLDSELADSRSSDDQKPAAEGEGEAEKKASLPSRSTSAALFME